MIPEPIPDEAAPLPPPGKLLASAEVISLAEVAAKRAEKLGAVIAELEAGVARRGEDAAASAAAAGFPKIDQQSAARKIAEKARAEISANSEDARWSYLREVNAAAEAVALTAALFASPQTVLARAGLGSAERTHYQQQLEGSGPVELRNMAALALATNNKALGAAIMSVVERMPRRERPVSPAELAERLVGEETRLVQNAVARIRHAAQAALNLNREFASGKARPAERLKLALNKREAK